LKDSDVETIDKTRTDSDKLVTLQVLDEMIQVQSATPRYDQFQNLVGPHWQNTDVHKLFPSGCFE